MNDFFLANGSIFRQIFYTTAMAYDRREQEPFPPVNVYVCDRHVLVQALLPGLDMHDIGIVIVDYLQLIQGSDRYKGNRVQEVTEISRGLKILARELEIPVVALAQLSRSVTGREDPRPVLSDLRESGSIEQDADLVMFLHRPDYYRQNDDNYEETHITELLVAKHRHGAVGKIELYFHPELLRFMSLDKTHD